MIYRAITLSDGQSPPGLAAVEVLADVTMASVEVDDFTVDVTFTVTSLTDGNDTCFTSQTSE